MNAFLYYLAWEWINISLEYMATAWVKLPRWWLAVVGVNLATHPAFVVLLNRFGHSASFVLPCEIVIFGIESLLLMAIYGFCRWRFLFGLAFLMNAASYLTGLVIECSEVF